MANRIIVKPNQTIWDIALQEHGSIEGVFNVLAANPELNLSDNLDESEISIVENQVINAPVQEYFKAHGIYPASLKFEA